MPEGWTTADIEAWYRGLEAAAPEHRARPAETGSQRRRRQEGPTVTERLAAYPDRAAALFILTGFPRPEVGLGPDPPLPRVREPVTWAALQREQQRRDRRST